MLELDLSVLEPREPVGGLRNGVDILFTPAGEAEGRKCAVCQDVMTVRRNVNGPTSLFEAMGGRAKLHDVFVCRHAGQQWHLRARELFLAAAATPSPTLRAILLSDLRSCLSGNTAS